jgi:DNA polymerase III subunit epsilon
MLDWLKNINKEYPEFWKNYLSKFEKKSNRFVVLSTDTSGLDPEKDIILSIGSIAVLDNNVIINDVFEVVFLQYKYIHDNGLVNEYLADKSQVKLPESEAIQAFIEYLGNAVLVGHRINFDVEMINEALEKMKCGRLKNEALDIEVMYKKLNDINDKQFTLDDLLKTFKITKSDRYSSSEDAYSIALLFLKLKSRLGIN